MLALLALAVTVIQPLRVRAVAVATMADALDLPVPRPLAATVERREGEVAGVVGDLYDPGGQAPAIVLIPGAAPDGREDTRVRRLAHAMAASDRAVFVPELAVYDQELVPEDVERVVRVVHRLGDDERGPAAVVGTSFGGTLGLLAAADPRLEGRIAKLAVFGAYLDLVGVVQATTTGVSLVGDRAISWDADPRAEDIVRDQLLGLLAEEHRTAVRAALEGEQDPDALPAPARAAVDLLTHDDPTRTVGIAERLPEPARERIREVSPSTVIDRIEAPVLAMHSRDDPAAPYGELVRLGEQLPHARLITLERFDHVEVDLDSPRELLRASGDLRGTWRFASGVLRAQEGWWP